MPRMILSEASAIPKNTKKKGIDAYPPIKCNANKGIDLDFNLDAYYLLL